MDHPPAESSSPRSLAETHTEGIRFLAPDVVVSGKACLLQIYPAAVHSEMIRLTGQRTLIGREVSCDVALEDTAVSRNHAVIEFDGSRYSVADLGSRNGTFVDDQPLQGKRSLQGGELIRIGSTILKFMASMDEEAQYHAVVHELMTRDPLTHAMNRGYLMSALDRMLRRSQRSGCALSVILIDIDYFKRVNDTWGHLVGDEVLRVFAERIRSVLRPDQILCRLGGEEFVILTEKACLKETLLCAERIRQNVAELPFPTQAGSLTVTCSLGVAEAGGISLPVTVDLLLAAADQQLYAAKKGGRNQVQPPSSNGIPGA